MTKGRCNLCNGIFSKRTMVRHLASCKKGRDSPHSPAGKPRKKRAFHVVVEGRYSPGYWMHIQVPAGARLRELDGFLRDTWLECCGHLSAFEIEGETYLSHPEGDEEGMEVALGDVLYPGLVFYHEYDFGTTTELCLRVLSEGEVEGRSVRLLARNEPPVIRCESCGRDAAQVCAQCIYEGAGWLCDECAAEHECGVEMLLPVVNSPRVGMCGYVG